MGPEVPGVGAGVCYAIGMEGGILYLRFVISMAVGMLGVTMVLVKLLDTVLADWDIVADAREILAKPGILKATLADLQIFGDEPEQLALATRLKKNAWVWRTFSHKPS